MLAETVRRSFQDVAERFGLNPENAPRHPSNCTEEWVVRDMDRGVRYFVIEEDRNVSGCVAVERANAAVCYLERLAVLPQRRRHGLGRALVRHVLSEAKSSGANRVEIGIISSDEELKRWYERIGFAVTESREFPHLPFRVIFLSYDLTSPIIKVCSETP